MIQALERFADETVILEHTDAGTKLTIDDPSGAELLALCLLVGTIAFLFYVTRGVRRSRR